MVLKNLATRRTSNRFISLMLIVYYWLESFIRILIPMAWYKHKDVKDKKILITGAGSGIGQLMALEFLRLGAKVIIWDINQDGMKTTERMAKEENLNTKNLSLYYINLADSKAIIEKAKLVKEEHGFIDILVNNAGVVSGQNFLEIPDEKIDLTFRVNSISHFYMIKSFLPDMIKKQDGHIVTVASVAGNFGVCGLTDYCASKFANVGMDLALRVELEQAHLSDKIKTTIVKPYFITTGMFSGADPGVFSFLKPEYVASKIVEGVLIEAKELYLPYFFHWLLTIGPLLPEKCQIPLYDFVGGFEYMANFHGRVLPPLKKNENDKKDVPKQNSETKITDDINNNDWSKKSNGNQLTNGLHQD